MSDAGAGGRAPSAGLFEKPTVSCELPQLYPLDKRKVPDLPARGSAGGHGVRKLRGDVKLYNEVVDGLNVGAAFRSSARSQMLIQDGWQQVKTDEQGRQTWAKEFPKSTAMIEPPTKGVVRKVTRNLD